MGREIEQGSGRFHCPECDCEEQYRLYRVASYFTLYFIPLFETRHHGDYVKCRGCRQQYKPAVLDYRPPSQVERLVHSIRAELDNGTPLQMAKTKLVNSGVESEAAENLVAIAAGEPLKNCSACNLSFAGGVERCSICGKKL
jgi:hypothetical protein